MTDEELMDLVKNDQLNHLAELFKRYHRRLYNYFVKVTRRQVLSEDLTQVVFERIIQYRHSFSGQSSFQGWIFRIAKNCLKDHYRRKSLVDHNVSTDTLDLEDASVEEQDNNLNEQRYRLRCAMSKLKVEHREILTLTRLENLSYQEVGPILGLSESAIKARVHRAMKSLKKAFWETQKTI